MTWGAPGLKLVQGLLFFLSVHFLTFEQWPRCLLYNLIIKTVAMLIRRICSWHMLIISKEYYDNFSWDYFDDTLWCRATLRNIYFPWNSLLSLWPVSPCWQVTLHHPRTQQFSLLRGFLRRPYVTQHVWEVRWLHGHWFLWWKFRFKPQTNDLSHRSQ